ncbi:MAG: hypothetical protein WBG81_10595 [Rhodanobacter sp.]
MAMQSVPQEGATKEAVLSALRIEQMVWVLNREWGTVDGSTHSESCPSLNEDQVAEIAARADKLLRYIITGERTALRCADALAAAANVTPFTKQKKRGAKVRIGPCAAILAFPTCSAPGRLSGEHLLSTWAWIKSNHSGWDDEKLSGSCEKKEWQKLFIEEAAREAIKGKPMPDGDAIRKEIAEHRAIIEKRVRVKDWLETRGVNWDEVKNPEQAMFFIFDRLHADGQPARA